MKRFGILFVIFLFCITNCSLDSGNTFLRDIYDYDVQDKDYPAVTTKSVQQKDDNYEDDYDMHWFPAEEIKIGKPYRQLGPRNRFRKRILNKKRRRIPRIRGLNHHFALEDNNEVLPPNSVRFHKRPKHDPNADAIEDEEEELEAEEKRDSKERNQWIFEKVGKDDYNRKLVARQPKTKLSAGKERNDRCEEVKSCNKDHGKGHHHEQHNHGNVVNVSYVFIPGQPEIAIVKEADSNATGGHQHTEESTEGTAKCNNNHNNNNSKEHDTNGEHKGAEKPKPKCDESKKSEKVEQKSPDVLVINKLVTCEIVRQNSTDEDKKEPNAETTEPPSGSTNMTNNEENRKPAEPEKQDDILDICGPLNTTNGDEHMHSEEKDKSNEKPKDNSDAANKTTETGCGGSEESGGGVGHPNSSTTENMEKKAQILLINKFLKCEVVKPKVVDNMNPASNGIIGEAIHGPMSPKENGAKIRDDSQYAYRTNDGASDSVLGDYPKNSNDHNKNTAEEDNEKALHPGHDQVIKPGSQYENLKFQLGNEIFNCTAVRLGNFLATSKLGKDGEELRPEQLLELGKHSGTAQNRTGAGLNLNITINGVVLSSNKAKKLYGNGTIRLAPERAKKRERHERGIKIPFMKKLMTTREDNDPSVDDDRDDKQREDGDDMSMCRPKKNKTCNAPGRPRRPPEGGQQQPQQQQNQQQPPQKPQQGGPLNDAAAEAGVTSMRLSSEIVKMVSQMVCSNPKMRTLWPSLSKNKPFLAKNLQSPLRSSAKCSERKHIEDMVRRAMASVNEIIEFEIQSRSCVPLSDDLAEFYEKILSTHAKQARRKEEREEMLNKAETLEEGGGDDLKQKRREGKRSRNSEDPNDDLQDSSLYDMIHSRKMQYEREVQEDRQRREANRRMSRLLDTENNSSLIRQLRHLYTPAFIKLNSAAESLERTEAIPDVP